MIDTDVDINHPFDAMVRHSCVSIVRQIFIIEVSRITFLFTVGNVHSFIQAVFVFARVNPSFVRRLLFWVSLVTHTNTSIQKAYRKKRDLFLWDTFLSLSLSLAAFPTRILVRRSIFTPKRKYERRRKIRKKTYVFRVSNLVVKSCTAKRNALMKSKGIQAKVFALSSAENATKMKNRLPQGEYAFTRAQHTFIYNNKK